MALTDKEYRAAIDRQRERVQAKIRDHRANLHPSIVAAEQAAKARAGDKQAADNVDLLIAQGNAQARPVANTFGTFHTPEGIQIQDADDLITKHCTPNDAIEFNNKEIGS